MLTTKELKVLIVDDSKNIRRLVSVILGKEGYTFIEAGNGIDALEKASLERPDLIILDIIIPGINGLKVCEEIRRNPKLKETGIIILTSEATYEARSKAHAAGADVFIIKPFEPTDLRTAAREVLKGRSDN